MMILVPTLNPPALYLAAFAITGGVNVPANQALALIDPQSGSAASAWSDFTQRWQGPNHMRSVAALAGAVLMAWR